MIGNLGVVEVLGAVALVVAGIWYYLGKNYNFWKKLGVPGPEPIFFFGNIKDFMLAKVSNDDFVKNICDQFPEAPMVGIYERGTPLLILRDLDLIKDVLIKDFPNFAERGIETHEGVEPLSAHLFNLETERWRPLRSRFSPVFTSGKMKHMFALIQECANYFVQYVDDLVNKGGPIDCREIAAKFTTDVIGSCAFGLQMRSDEGRESQFRKIGRQFFALNAWDKTFSILRDLYPRLYKLIGEPKRTKEITDFFLTSIKETIEYRRKNNVRRGDFVDTLIELQDNSDKFDFELTDDLVAAQAFLFFIAGFETSSSTISHALYELAQVPDLQERLRQEILESLEATNGEVSYDSVKQIKYLDMVFKETLRMRPPVVFLHRRALNSYTFRGTNITIPKGQKMWIPIHYIQHDPKYYPNPEAFDPERFSDEMKNTRHPMTHLPFGDGPRNCVGARFGVYQTKLGLIKILSKYKVEVTEKTMIPYESSPFGLVLTPAGGVHLHFSRIDSSK